MQRHLMQQHLIQQQLKRWFFSWALCAPLLTATPAFAATRTWVSGVGDDGNPCSRTAPCATFSGAISTTKTAAGGEIDALDPGGFGAFTVSHAITIDGGPGIASLLVGTGNGVTVNAGASDHVILRNLSINGIGDAAIGIKYTGGASLTLENVKIFGFKNEAIDVNVATGAGALYASDTVMSNNGSDGVSPNVMLESVTATSTSLWRVFSADAPIGVEVAAAASAVSIFDSVFFGHGTAGLWSSFTGAAINMDRGMIADCGTAVQADATVRLSAVMTSQNTTGITGTVTSFGNNRISAGNTADLDAVTGAINAIPLQ